MITLTALFTAFLFYFFPIIIGRPLIRIFYRHHLNYPFISYFITGALVLYSLVFLINYTILRLFSSLPFEIIFQALLASLAIVCIPANFFFRPTDIQLKKYAFPSFFAGTCAIGVYYLWQLGTIYPFNWDIYEHQTLVNTILHGHWSFITSHVTDTFGFNGYSTIFHTLIAGTQTFLPSPVFPYWHSLSMLHFTFVILASYFLTKEVTNNKVIAILSATLGAFIFDSNISFTSLFFIPQTFTAVSFVFLFTQLISEVKHHRLPSPFLIALGSIFLILNHYVVGLVAVGIYTTTWLYFRNHKYILGHINRRLYIEIGLFVAFLLIIFSSAIPLGFLNNGEAVAFTSTLTDKFLVMKQVYGFIFLLFLPIGVSTLLKRNHEMEVGSLVITIGLLALILMQLPYVMKFYVLARFFVHILIAMGIFTLFRQIKNRWLLYSSYSFLVITLTGIFITNTVTWKGGLEYQNLLTHISPAEIQAADFLKKHYNSTATFLISDPATQHILEPFSNINTQGGAYMNSKTREILSIIGETQSTRDIEEKLFEIQDDVTGPSSGKRLLVLSGRYFIWQDSSYGEKHSLNYNVWYPADLTLDNKQQIERFVADPDHFMLVYQSPTLAIFEVKR